MVSEDPRAMELAQRAYNAMAAGREGEAARLWSELHALAPDNPQALLNLGQIAMRRGDKAAGLNFLRRAAAAAPRDAIMHLNLAFACQQVGDHEGEGKAYEGALTADPYCYPALLGKASIFERAGKQRQAARWYKDALRIEPPAEQMPPQLAAQFAHAREVVESNAEQMEAYLRAQLSSKTAEANVKLDRFDQCVGAVTGRKKIYTCEPTLLHYPGLPAIQFYDDAEFPWLPDLEAATETILDELKALLEHDVRKFRPYVAYSEGTPVNQWHELNHSDRWSSYFLWEKGKRIDENCARCPKTAALLDRLHMPDIPGFAPTAMFSVLLPHTHIPPHTGVTNTRLVVHLPLIVPDKCFFRVGNDTRKVVKGKAWAFDDTIEHEAWNDSDETRIILIIDVWNPNLSETERGLVRELLQGMRGYYGEEFSELG